MGAPPKVVDITANRAFEPVEIQIWKNVPLIVHVTLAEDVVVEESAALVFEIHTKREFSEDSLLARTDLTPANEGEAPYDLIFTGREMNLPIAEGRDSRQLFGVLYTRYYPDIESDESSDDSSSDEDEPSGELDILAIVNIDFERHNASPSATPPETLPLSLSEADAVAMFAPSSLISRVAAVEAMLNNGALPGTLEVKTALTVRHASNASHASLADDGTLSYTAVGETNPRELAFPPDVTENQAKFIATRDWVLEQLAP